MTPRGRAVVKTPATDRVERDAETDTTPGLRGILCGSERLPPLQGLNEAILISGPSQPQEQRKPRRRERAFKC